MFSNLSKIFISKLVGFQVVCILFVLGFCTCVGYSLEYLNYHEKIYKNIQVCHIDLSGKTTDEAKSTIKTKVIEPLLSKELSLGLNGMTVQIPLNDFYITSDLHEVIDSVANYSNSLTLLEKWNLLHGNEIKNFNLSLEFDEDALLTHTKDFINSFNTSPSDADILVDSLGEITTVSHADGQVIDIEKLLAQITTTLESYLHNPSTSHSLGETTTVNSSSDSTIYVDLTKYLNVTTPNIKLEDLQTVNSLVASYSTNYTPTAANAKNIELAATTINDTLLMPGDIFSFNELVGDTTLDKGYVYAPVIINSKMTQGVGGGVCQVSSTLYNAILSLGILPTERRPHSRPSSYVSLGLDSAIDWGTIDLKFENTLDYPLYISAYTQNGKLHTNLYSNESLLDTSYELSSEVIKVLPAKTEYIKDSTLPTGSSVLVSSGNDGYQVKVTRDTYQNDELVASEVISWDTYNPISTVYRVG